MEPYFSKQWMDEMFAKIGIKDFKIFYVDEIHANCNFWLDNIQAKDPLPDGCVHAIIFDSYERREGACMEIHYVNDEGEFGQILTDDCDPNDEDSGWEPAYVFEMTEDGIGGKAED